MVLLGLLVVFSMDILIPTLLIDILCFDMLLDEMLPFDDFGVEHILRYEFDWLYTSDYVGMAVEG